MTARVVLLTMLCVALAAATGVLGLMFGAKPMSLAAAAKALLSPDQGTDGIILWTLRMPRMIAAFLGGAALAVAGYLLQAMTRNPLAAPDLTGVTGGTVMVIVAAFVMFPAVSPALYPAIGLVGGLVGAFATLWLAGGGRDSPLRLALAGVSVSLFLAALTTLILLRGGPQSPTLLFWLSGGFQGRSWDHVVFMTPWLIAGFALSLVAHRIVTLLALGEETAASMGVNTALWRFLLLLGAVSLVAGVTAVAGPIAFIGLATPHIARLLGARATVESIALNAAIGGLLLIAADTIGRSVAAPRELPIGILTALIGGPFFVYLTLRRQAVVA